MIAFPNAKINAGLLVTANRNDGYHDIETLMLPVNLCDVLEMVPSEKFDLKILGCSIDNDIYVNTCYKSFSLIQQDYNISPVKIILYKNIPTGAGLGGGSSDGTFTLKLLNQWFDLKISDIKLKYYADLIGSDCNFFLKNTPAFAKEKGDKLDPVSINLSNYYITIIKTEISVSTAWAYSQIVPKQPACNLKEIVYKYPPSEWKYYLHNDFEQVVFDKYPVLREIKQTFYKKGALYTSMTGSGAAIYGIAEKPISIDIPNAFYWSGKFL